MDKATAFRIKIASKNQLRQLLKQKKKLYSQMEDAPELSSTKEQLRDEIDAIQLELETYN